jgi:hypothetical protein
VPDAKRLNSIKRTAAVEKTVGLNSVIVLAENRSMKSMADESFSDDNTDHQSDGGTKKDATHQVEH